MVSSLTMIARLLIIILLLLASSPALADKLKPFGQHTMNAGLNLGLGVSGSDISFQVGGNFGYFVLPGLEPGLSTDVTFGTDQDTTISLMPYVRWVFWRAYPFSPYLKVQGGRWFVIGSTDISLVGGGVGFVFFITDWMAIQAEGLAMYLVPDEGPCPNDRCVVPVVGLNFGFFWGLGGGISIGGIDDDDDDEGGIEEEEE